MRVLIIDDDLDIVESLQTHLSARGFATDVAHTGMQGLECACVNEYDLVILDVNLPDMNGENVCVEIRHSGRTVPILMLSVVLDSARKAKLLNAGADDYLNKPFAFDELLARLRALLRRPRALIPDVLRTGDLSVDSHTRAAQRGERDLKLTRIEFALLEHLLRGQGTIISKTALIEHIWDSHSDPFSESIETHMTNLRRKIGDPSLIHTIRGRGYKVVGRV